MRYQGKERRMSTEHQRGYQQKDIGEQMGVGAAFACGFIVALVILYVGLHYAGVA